MLKFSTELLVSCEEFNPLLALELEATLKLVLRKKKDTDTLLYFKLRVLNSIREKRQ